MEKRRRRIATVGAMILACVVALAAAARAAPDIARATDLSRDAREARESRRVIVVLFTTAGCTWCERVREGHLKPLLANPADAARVVVREIDIDSRDALIDFTGGATTHAAFAARNVVRLAPTVMILGPGGERLAAPLVGFGTADYYSYYLDERITAGLAKLNGR